MKQEWYILINGRKEGPFTPLELKADSRVTPDTLAWKHGFLEWVAIRFIPELKFIFKDEPESKPLHEDPNAQPLGSDSSEQATLTIQEDPSQFFLWILLLILVLIYVFYQLHQ